VFNGKKRGNKIGLRIFLIVLFIVNFTACINQEDIDSKNSEDDIIQPELSEEGFIELLNNILAEKVSLEMFGDYDGRYTYIRNTFDRNETKIRVSIDRTATTIYISISPGHFGEELSDDPEMIDTRGLFTPLIESQADLTPPSNFKKRKEYTIEVTDYEGTLRVSRGHVSLYFENIGGLSPTPTPPGPRSLISQVIYYGFISAFILVIIAFIYAIFVWRRRRKS
jgi:hypothetical protein